MVYCTKCGTENEEDAQTCTNCGNDMKPLAYKHRRKDWDMEDDCFGGRSRTTWPMLIGIFLILLGASTLLDDVYWWANFDTLWPLFIIAIGVLIITNAMKR